VIINPFIRPEEKFPDWFLSEMDKMFPNFCGDKFVSDDIVFSNKSLLEKYTNKKILIAAGGPSTNEINWKAKDYDFIWSMNHGFKNEKIRQAGIDMISIGPEVSLDDPILLQFLKTSNPLVSFEMRERWRIPIFIFKLQNFSDKYSCFCYETRFLGKTGVGARLAILASFVGAKEVNFIGMDGPNFKLDGKHSFEPGKVNLPAGCSFDDMPQTMTIYQEHYDFLWNFLTSTFPDIIYKNIGYENELHKVLRDRYER